MRSGGEAERGGGGVQGTPVRAPPACCHGSAAGGEEAERYLSIR